MLPHLLMDYKKCPYVLLFNGVMCSLFNGICIFHSAKAAGTGEDRKMAENAEKLGQVQEQ